jgi:phosphoribosyl-AMP cyclohydrolase / phosphoribosyl-ATP pyrophosphohydrolase
MNKEEIAIDIETLNWNKVNGLMPAIIQDNSTLQVLMLGYMNKAALQQSLATEQITFYSRSKQRLWTKGEISGNTLSLLSIIPDCDNDSLLVLVKPHALTCHLNNRSCFGTSEAPGLGILATLEAIIATRYQQRPADSYLTQLFSTGIHRIAQKVGEEGVEVALASVTGSTTDIKNEAADLLFHLLVLLKACHIELAEVLQELSHRAELSHKAEILEKITAGCLHARSAGNSL